MTHDEIQELLGAYALDAVEDPEAEAVELHLRSCPRCQAEVEAHRETAAWMAHGGASAPEGVWDRIADTLEGAPPPVEIARILPWETSERRRRPVVTWLAGVAAALVLVVGAVAVNQQRRIDDLRQRDALEVALADAMSDPRARRVTLRPADATDGEAVRAVVLPDGTGYLAAEPLTDIDSSRTYQLWGISGAKVVSLGVLGRDPEIVTFHASPDVTALAITEEERGGVVTSRNAPVVVGTVPTSA